MQMSFISTSEIVSCVIAFIAVAFLCTLKASDGGKGASYAPVPILTANERRLFRVLKAEFPDLHFFPQVSMGGVMKPAVAPNDRQYMPAFRRISQNRIDFVVCGENLDIVCLVELDDSTHNHAKDAARDKMTASAGYETVRVNNAKFFDLRGLRQTVNAATVLRSRDSRLGSPSDLHRRPAWDVTPRPTSLDV